MGARGKHCSSPVDGSSFKLHTLPSPSGAPADDDPRFEYRKGRASRDLAFANSKDASPASSTERFPDLEDSPHTLSTPTPRWKRLSMSRPSFYVWARRLRIGAEKLADGSLFAIQQPRRKRRPLYCVLFLLALALMIL
jgi:hypothetical protein